MKTKRPSRVASPGIPVDSIELVGKNVPRPPAPGSLGPGDAPCAMHPGFTRKEACEARRTRRAPGGMDIKRMVAALDVQGASNAEISKKTGYAERYVSAIRKRDPDVIAGRLEIAERAGATVEKAATTLVKQMDAKRSVVIQHKGRVKKILEFEDNAAQVAAASKVGEWHGLGLPRGGSGSGEHPGPRFVIINEPESVFFADPSLALKGPDGTQDSGRQE